MELAGHEHFLNMILHNEHMAPQSRTVNDANIKHAIFCCSIQSDTKIQLQTRGL